MSLSSLIQILLLITESDASVHVTKQKKGDIFEEQVLGLLFSKVAKKSINYPQVEIN